MAFKINTVTLSGNLVKDPELRSTQSGKDVCSLRIAFNRREKDSQGEWGDVASFIDVSVWEGPGRWIAEHLAKGEGVVVQGELRIREWEKDGRRGISPEVVFASVLPVPRGDGTGSTPVRTGRSDVPVSEDDFAPAAAKESAVPTADDDIPF